MTGEGTKSYILYLDASGGVGWPAPYGNDPDRWYVQGGCALTPSMDRVAHVETERILSKYLHYREEGVRELRYSALIHGDGPYRWIRSRERLEMADEVFQLLLRLKPVLFATVLDKLVYRELAGTNAQNPREYAFASTVTRFCAFLERGLCVGYIVMDTEGFHRDREIQDFVRKVRRCAPLPPDFSGLVPDTSLLEPLMNAPSFLPSECSPGLQLADFCSKAVFLHCARRKSGRFSQIRSLFEVDAGIRQEPSIAMPRE